MDLGLRDKVVLVTGASAGIGLAAARMFAAEGAHVAIAARDRDRLNDAGRAITAAGTPGCKVVAIAGDLAEPDVPARVVDEVTDALGPVDVLVNNVGLAYQATFHDLTDDDWDSLWQLNVMSFVRAIQAVLPAMRERRSGAIVNVASTAGKRPSVGMPNYSVTKAAVLSLSRLVADAYAGEGIRSLAICPGPTSTFRPRPFSHADQPAPPRGVLTPGNVTSSAGTYIAGYCPSSTHGRSGLSAATVVPGGAV